MNNNIRNKLKELDIKDDSRLYVDVGTSIDAPNSAQWLLADDKAVVIGIEPSTENIKAITEGRDPEGYDHPYLRLSDMTVQYKGKTQSSIEGRFVLLPCAIDLVSSPTTMDFYCTDKNTGCASLLKPTAELEKEVGIKNIEKVDVFSLSHILDEIKYSGMITVVKTDAQGKDYDVVQSLKHHFPNVMLLMCEYNTCFAGTDIPGYEKSRTRDDEIKLFENLQHQGFDLVAADWSNILLWNRGSRQNNTMTEDEYNYAMHLISDMDWFGE